MALLRLVQRMEHRCCEGTEAWCRICGGNEYAVVLSDVERHGRIVVNEFVKLLRARNVAWPVALPPSAMLGDLYLQEVLARVASRPIRAWLASAGESAAATQYNLLRAQMVESV